MNLLDAMNLVAKGHHVRRAGWQFTYAKLQESTGVVFRGMVNAEGVRDWQLIKMLSVGRGMGDVPMGLTDEDVHAVDWELYVEPPPKWKPTCLNTVGDVHKLLDFYRITKFEILRKGEMHDELRVPSAFVEAIREDVAQLKMLGHQLDVEPYE